MNRALSIMVLTGLAVGLPVASLAAEITNRPEHDAVANVAAVTLRDGSGRAQRFMDSGSREFAVKYDEQQRVRSVEATRAPHISDIASVSYAPNGMLIGVRFRTGYTVLFDTRPNGAQTIRDSQGGALIRTGRVTQPIDSAAADQTAKLAAAVTEIESLLSALGQPPR